MQQIPKIQNNLQNIPAIYKITAPNRVSRGKSISNSYVLSCAVKSGMPLQVSASVQGSYSNNYIVFIQIQEDGKGVVIHDCPDFRKRRLPCKHIVKILLVVEKEICEKICENFRNLTVYTDKNKVKDFGTNIEAQKAQKLLDSGDIPGALHALENAGQIEEALRIAYEKGLFRNAIRLLDLHGKEPTFSNFNLSRLLSGALEEIEAEPFSTQLSTLTALAQYVKKNPPIQNNLEELPAYQAMNIAHRAVFHGEMASLSNEVILSLEHGESTVDEIRNQIATRLQEQLFQAIAEIHDWEEVEAVCKMIQMTAGQLSFDQTILVQNYKEDLEVLLKTGLQRKFSYLKGLCIKHTQQAFVRDLSLNAPGGSYRSYRSYRGSQSSQYLMGGPKKSDSPLVWYILEKCGFLETHPDYITTHDLVKNFPILNELFNVQARQSEAKQFWGENYNKVVYHCPEETPDIDLNLDWQYLKEEAILVEWDLSHYPVKGSFIMAFQDGYSIPQQGDPLTGDLQPFEVTLCKRIPIQLQGGVKILKPLQKVTIRDAIRGIYEGVPFIGNLAPFHTIQKLRDGELDEYAAWREVNNRLKEKFFPNGEEFRSEFTRFVNTQILTDRDRFYQKLRANRPPESDFIQLVSNLLGLNSIKSIFQDDALVPFIEDTKLDFSSLGLLRAKLHAEVHKILFQRIQENASNPRNVNVDILFNHPNLQKFAAFIVNHRLMELKECQIKTQSPNEYDLSQFQTTYYGQKIIMEVFGVPEMDRPVTQEEWDEVKSSLDFLDIRLSIS